MTLGYCQHFRVALQMSYSLNAIAVWNSERFGSSRVSGCHNVIRMAKVGNGSRRLAEATCGPIQIQPCYVAHVSLLSAFLGCFTDQCLIHSMQLLYEIANILFYSIEGRLWVQVRFWYRDGISEPIEASLKYRVSWIALMMFLPVLFMHNMLSTDVNCRWRFNKLVGCWIVKHWVMC